MYTFTDEDRKKANITKDIAAVQKVFQIGSKASTAYLKKLLIQEGRPYKCELCENPGTHNNKLLVLQLDHINGISYDNRKENLRFLCPNCHSQTETYCGKGNTGKKIVSDDVLIEAIKTTPNIRQALIKVGLTPKGGNYSRAINLKQELS